MLKKGSNSSKMTPHELIEYCKTAIAVCQERIEIEGPNGDKFWVSLKEHWEKILKEQESKIK
jgi:hypothetical protein